MNRSSTAIKNITILAKGASISLVGRSLSRIFLLIGQAFLAKFLGLQKYGLFALGWSILQVSANAGQIGLPQGIIRFGSQYWQKDDISFRGVVQQSLGLAIFFSALLGAGLYIFAPQISFFFSKPELIPIIRGTAIALVLLLLLRVLAAATRISQRVQFSILAEDLLPSIFLLIGAWAFLRWFQQGLPGSINSVILAYGIGLVSALGFVFYLYPGIFTLAKSGSFWKQILGYSGPASLAGLFGIVSRWIARLFLGYYRPEADVGLYQAASQIAALSAIILAATNTIFTPMISGLFSRGQLDELNELYKVSTKWGFYISIPFVILIFFFSKEIMLLIYGQEYAQGGTLLIILAIGQLINTLSGAVAPMHLMLGYQKKWMMLTGFVLVGTFLINLLLIPIWGSEGAAIADMLSITSLNIIALFQLNRLVHIFPYDKRYLKGLSAAFLTAFLVWSISHLNIHGVLLKVSICSVFSISSFLFLIVLFGLDYEDKKIIDILLQRFSTKDVEKNK